MKNLLKLIGVITLAMVVAFSMTACGEPAAAADPVPEPGKLTLTDFAFNLSGYFVMATASHNDGSTTTSFIAARRFRAGSSMDLGEISNTVATLNVYSNKDGAYAPFEGGEANTANVAFTVYLFEKISDPIPKWEYTTPVIVTFDKGNASGKIPPDATGVPALKLYTGATIPPVTTPPTTSIQF